MPLVDSNQASLWDGSSDLSLYRAWVNNLPVGYQRMADGSSPFIGNDAKALIAALESRGLLKTHRLVLIGAGFGFVHDEFLAAGYGPTADGTANGKLLSVDTSTYIQANLNGNARVPILNADVNAATGRRTVRQQFGSNNAAVDWIVTEDVLGTLIGAGPTPGGNNEIVPLCQNLRTFTANVAHWISPLTASSDPRLNWKAMSEWKAWVAPDLVIQRGTSAVL
jgi:hypothetical protein